MMSCLKQPDGFASLQQTVTFLETYTVEASELKRALFMQTLDALRSQLPPPAADKPDALQLWSSTLRLGLLVEESLHAAEMFTSPLEIAHAGRATPPPPLAAPAPAPPTSILGRLVSGAAGYHAGASSRTGAEALPPTRRLRGAEAARALASTSTSRDEVRVRVRG